MGVGETCLGKGLHRGIASPCAGSWEEEHQHGGEVYIHEGVKGRCGALSFQPGKEEQALWEYPFSFYLSRT